MLSVYLQCLSIDEAIHNFCNEFKNINGDNQELLSKLNTDEWYIMTNKIVSI